MATPQVMNNFLGVVKHYKTAVEKNKLTSEQVVFGLRPGDNIAKSVHPYGIVGGLVLEVKYDLPMERVFPEQMRKAPDFEFGDNIVDVAAVKWDLFVESLRHRTCHGRVSIYSPVVANQEMVGFPFWGNWVSGERVAQPGMLSCWPNITKITPNSDARWAANYLVDIFAELKREPVMSVA
jgi:hypothetical protein